MKFIHIADLHLGVKPDRDKPWAKERERDNWQAFEDVINRAKEDQIQLLLVAGDLFHRQPLIRELKDAPVVQPALAVRLQAGQLQGVG